MRRSLAVLLGVCAAGAAGLALAAATTHETRAFTLGVTPGGVVAPLKRGDRACQAPVTVPDGAAAFDRVVVALGTYHRPGPAVEISVAPARGGPAIARGTLAVGYPDIDRAPTHAVPVGHVATRAPLRICVRNLGDHSVAVYGNADASSRTSTATLNGKALKADLVLSFQRGRSRSAASLVGAMFARSALFHASWVGAWTYVALALLVLLAVPALLALALRAAQGERSASGATFPRPRR